MSKQEFLCYWICIKNSENLDSGKVGGFTKYKQ